MNFFNRFCVKNYTLSPFLMIKLIMLCTHKYCIIIKTWSQYFCSAVIGGHKSTVNKQLCHFQHITNATLFSTKRYLRTTFQSLKVSKVD